MNNTINQIVPSKKSPYKNKSYIAPMLTSAIGTVVPIACMMKHQKTKNPFKLTYGLRDMFILSSSAVVGGVAGGLIGADKKSRGNKLKEGFFQILNATIPPCLVAGSVKLLDSSRFRNNKVVKIVSVIGSLVVGMLGVASLSNLILDPKDKYPDRKIKLKDCVVNADDIIGALVLAKFPLIEKLKIEYLLPLLYTYCGYKAGKAK